MPNGPVVGWELAVGLALLLLAALIAARAGRIPVGREITSAAVRAMVQLAAVSTIIALVLGDWRLSVAFAFVMFLAASGTAAQRVGTLRDWRWVLAAILSGAGPVLALIFALGVVPATGAAIVPIAGVTIGGAMTAMTLTGQRAFGALRESPGLVEAGLSVGFTRPEAIRTVILPHAPEALTPVLDQTRTVGLVALPGAFVGVILGGGSASEAAAAQVLVLVGLLAAETTVVAVTQRLIGAGRILPEDLRERLPDS